MTPEAEKLLLRKVLPPKPLDGAARARVAAAIDEAQEKALVRSHPWRLFALATAIGAIAALVLVANWHRHPKISARPELVLRQPQHERERMAARPELVLRQAQHEREPPSTSQPDNSALPLFQNGDGRALLISPGTAAPDEKSGSVRLIEGRLVARAIHRPVVVQTLRGKVILSVGSAAEVEVHSFDVQIAALSGTVRVKWSSGANVEILQGQRVSQNGPLPFDEKRAAEMAAAVGIGITPSVVVAEEQKPNQPAPRKMPLASQAPLQATPKPAAPENLAADAESQLFSEALMQLRRHHNAAAALGALDKYDAQFAHGRFGDEALLVRIEALLSDFRHDQALRRLDELGHFSGPRGAELEVLRGELRAQARRYSDAISDFGAALRRGTFAERALYGRASCYSELGDVAAARADLADYQSRFPDGKLAEQVREALGK